MGMCSSSRVCGCGFARMGRDPLLSLPFIPSCTEAMEGGKHGGGGWAGTHPEAGHLHLLFPHHLPACLCSGCFSVRTAGSGPRGVLLLGCFTEHFLFRKEVLSPSLVASVLLPLSEGQAEERDVTGLHCLGH